MTLYPKKNQIEKKKQKEIKQKRIDAEINPIYGGGDRVISTLPSVGRIERFFADG